VTILIVLVCCIELITGYTGSNPVRVQIKTKYNGKEYYMGVGFLDFCYIITPVGTRKLKDWLHYQRGRGVNQSNYGVSSINNARDLYFIFLDKEGNLGYHGIINEKETSNDLCLSSIPEDQVLNSHVMSYNKDGYIKHCKDYNSYTEWLSKRNVQRYVDIESHGQRIDGKNMLHCVRLIDVAKEIATEHTLNVRRPNAKYLIEIRKGKHKLETILDNCQKELESINKFFDESGLPNKVDKGEVLKLVTKIRKKAYE